MANDMRISAIQLNEQELSDLFVPIPWTSRGGFQSLLTRLQKKTDRGSGSIGLSIGEMERIHRYAFKYRNGGWQSRLIRIFGRSLGPDLGMADIRKMLSQQGDS
jgi:hypothetical protein